MGAQILKHDLREFVRKIYQNFVETDESVPSELRRALRAHERVPAFIDKMSAELNLVGDHVKKENVEQAVRDMCRFFISNVKRAAEEKATSPLEKARLISIQDEANRIRQAADKVEQKEGDSERVESAPKGEITRSEIVADFIEEFV
jgi:hypothetical protein